MQNGTNQSSLTFYQLQTGRSCADLYGYGGDDVLVAGRRRRLCLCLRP